MPSNNGMIYLARRHREMISVTPQLQVIALDTVIQGSAGHDKCFSVPTELITEGPASCPHRIEVSKKCLIFQRSQKAKCGN